MVDKYVVIDSEGNISYDPNMEAPESFPTLAAAEKRAKALAATCAGEKIGIYVLDRTAIVPVSPVQIEKVEEHD